MATRRSTSSTKMTTHPNNQYSWQTKAVVSCVLVAMLSVSVLLPYNNKSSQQQRPQAVSVATPTLQQRRKLQTTTRSIINTDALKNIQTKFYIYEDHAISRKLILNIKRSVKTPISPDAEGLDHLEKDLQAERDTLQALERHNLRTRNPHEARLYIIPWLISEMVAQGCRWEDCHDFDQAVEALRKHALYQEGHNHVLVSYGWFSFNPRFAAYVPALSRNYRVLENVTVASHYDAFGCLKLIKQQKTNSTEKGFNYLFPEELPVTKAFSIGLGVDAPFAIQTPTLDKFKASNYFVFYHSRNATWDPFGYGSTPFRKAPFDIQMENFPKSSIGMEMERDEWIEHFVSSQFCLVIRGDTPHSHSLLYAVRAGCIPVVISDHYQDYAGPFQSSIQMKDFCIFIKESDFIAKPKEALLQLQNVPDDEIKVLLHNLDVVQSIVLPDHHKSLFVQAFVKEALEANKRMVPQVEQRVPVEMGENQTIISGKTLRYRYPLGNPNNNDGDDKPVIVFGILSDASKPDPRFNIRNTWAAAQQKHHRVFFLVGGFWEDIQDEFYNFGDLVWIDIQEDYLLLTYKTLVFLHAVETMLVDDHYDYVFKADDDSYVGIPEISRILSKHQPHYWGICNLDEKRLTVQRNEESYWYTPKAMYSKDKYPVYAQGMGYALSRKHVQCILPHVATAKYMPWEDAAIGILSHDSKCGFECQRDEFEFDNDGLTTVQHNVGLRGSMLWIHWDQMKKQKLLEWVDKPPELKQLAQQAKGTTNTKDNSPKSRKAPSYGEDE